MCEENVHPPAVIHNCCSVRSKCSANYCGEINNCWWFVRQQGGFARGQPRPGRPPGPCCCGEAEASGPCWELISTGRRRRSQQRLCDGFVARLATCQRAFSSGVQLEWQALTFAGRGSDEEACIGLTGAEGRRWMRPALRRFVSTFWALPRGWQQLS